MINVNVKDQKIKGIISLLFILGYFAMVYVFLVGKTDIAEGQNEMVAMLIGVTTKAVIDIVTHYLKGDQSG